MLLYTTPMLNIFQQIDAQIKSAIKILILADKNSGDSIASALALLYFLRSQGKEADICAFGRPSFYYQKINFLPNYDEILDKIQISNSFIVSLKLNGVEIKNISHKIFKKNKVEFHIQQEGGSLVKENLDAYQSVKYDLVIAVGVNNLEAMGSTYLHNTDFFTATPIINIDNHPGNERFGEINLVNIKAISIAEILADFFQKNNFTLDESVADCLFTAITLKTANFKRGNIYPSTLDLAAKLTEIGARRDEIITKLYFSREISEMKIWGEALKNLKLNENGHITKTIVENLEWRNDDFNFAFLEEIGEEVRLSLPEIKIFTVVIKGEKSVKFFIYDFKTGLLANLTHEIKCKIQIESGVMCEVLPEKVRDIFTFLESLV